MFKQSKRNLLGPAAKFGSSGLSGQVRSESVEGEISFYEKSFGRREKCFLILGQIISGTLFLPKGALAGVAKGSRRNVSSRFYNSQTRNFPTMLKLH